MACYAIFSIYGHTVAFIYSGERSLNIHCTYSGERSLNIHCTYSGERSLIYTVLLF